jgi:hypothetical protein
MSREQYVIRLNAGKNLALVRDTLLAKLRRLGVSVSSLELEGISEGGQMLFMTVAFVM